MTTSNSAGVYVTERDISQRISAASTTIGAIVGISDRGPVMQRTLITDPKKFLAVFGTPNPRTSLMHYSALTFLEEANRLYVTRVVAPNALTAGCFWTVDDVAALNPVMHLTNFDDGTNQPLGKVDPFNTLGFDPLTPGIANIMGFFCAANPGLWNNNLFIRIRPSNKRGVALPDDPFLFVVEVFENFTSPNQPPDEAFVVSREFGLNGFNEQTEIQEVINGKSNLIRYRANPYAAPSQKVLSTFTEYLDGGSNGTPANESAVSLGWELYRDPENLDVNILIQGGFPSVAVQQKMVDISSQRMDAMAVLDIPSNKQRLADAIVFRRNELNINSSYGALYGPDVKIYDEFNDREIFVPASGFAAACFARTDREAATWFAPAGIDRGLLSIRGVRETYNQGDRDAFADAQINPIRVIPGTGFIIWGADTLQTQASALSNVNVRRLLNFVETSIKIAALYQNFEPNTEILWSRLTEICERFLKPIKAGRGLYYFNVQCNEKNNTPETIGNGDTILDVYLDPVIPAKRIFLNAVVNRTGARFTATSA